ncbi:MAG: hypothetical protein WC455_08890 [Dehalococcoidia bacterium]|jgi:hypothetical protein
MKRRNKVDGFDLFLVIATLVVSAIQIWVEVIRPKPKPVPVYYIVY